MTRKRNEQSRSKNEALRARVAELEDTLLAIREGRVDALVIHGDAGEQVFTLQGAEHPYRVLVESISEGAATLDASGTVLHFQEGGHARLALSQADYAAHLRLARRSQERQHPVGVRFGEEPRPARINRQAGGLAL